MCNDYELDMALEEMNAAIDRQLGLDLVVPPNFVEGMANRPYARRVYPRYFGLILRPIDPAAAEPALEPAGAAWGLVPGFHRGTLKEWRGATNNARCEDMAAKPSFRSAVKSRRCLIPATGFYEWTGPKGSKTRHRIARKDGDLLVFAGLWETFRSPDEGPIDTYTMVMTDALGDHDVAPFHDRQPVPLDRVGARTWLDLKADYAPLLTGPSDRTYVMDPPNPVAA